MAGAGPRQGPGEDRPDVRADRVRERRAPSGVLRGMDTALRQALPVGTIDRRRSRGEDLERVRRLSTAAIPRDDRDDVRGHADDERGVVRAARVFLRRMVLALTES